jgi:peptidoglycan hydrolase CwlO-like protein
MRKVAVLAIGLLITSISAAQAVSLKDCSQGSTKKRMACLQDNITTLNSSHEAVAAELRKDVADLTSTVNSLKGTVDTLNGKMNAINGTVGTLSGAVSTLKGQIPNLDSVVIEWTTHNGSCITYMGNNLVQLVDTCLDPNKNQFKIRTFHQ